MTRGVGFAQERCSCITDTFSYTVPGFTWEKPRRAFTENILRLHHVEPVEDAIHRRDQQPHPAGARAQDGNWLRLRREYRLDRLVYFERFEDIHNAIEREKQIKGWLRAKKVALIVSVNPAWRDLSLEWYERRTFHPESDIVRSSTRNFAKLSS